MSLEKEPKGHAERETYDCDSGRAAAAVPFGARARLPAHARAAHVDTFVSSSHGGVAFPKRSCHVCLASTRLCSVIRTHKSWRGHGRVYLAGPDDPFAGLPSCPRSVSSSGEGGPVGGEGGAVPIQIWHAGNNALSVVHHPE